MLVRFVGNHSADLTQNRQIENAGKESFPSAGSPEEAAYGGHLDDGVI